MPYGEFIAMMALLHSVMAVSIDGMLPALGHIAAELSPDAPNRAQLIVGSFVLGLGCGMLVMGPLSDSYGRKRVIAFGVALYLLGALGATLAPTLEALVAARILQGFGISATRIVGTALIRDLYQGRRMAQVVSTVMTIFIFMPAAAPAMGQAVLWVADWRAIFSVFGAIAAAALAWLMLRQPETLPSERRRPFRPAPIWAATREVLGHREVRLHILTLSLGFGQMLSLIASVQPIFATGFDRGDEFPVWFAMMSLTVGVAAFVNARLVIRLGMRRLATAAYAAQTALSLVLVPVWAAGLVPEALAFPLFVLWGSTVLFMAGITFGNLNALALEPMGHVAGLASSVIGAGSTVLAVAVAVPVGLAFDGTPLPLMVGVLACSAGALGLMRLSRGAAAPARRPS
jgi:DHA1 family bicyclomycin/chloramphenicol resistance-like MFS transporter